MTTRRPPQTRRRPGVVSTLAAGGLLLGGLTAAGPHASQRTSYPSEPAMSHSAAVVVDDHHPTGMGLVFGDEFDGTSLDRAAWCTRYQYGGGAVLQPGYDAPACTAAGGGTLDFLNDEQQRFRDVTTHLPDGRGTPLPAGQQGEPLHVVSGGVLSLRATRTGADPAYARYEAGMIRSRREFKPSADESLYLTARVRLPDVKGSWPAFWLAPGVRSGSAQWPPEIDIFEGELNRNGDNDNMLHMNAIGTHAGGEVYYRSDEYPDNWYRSKNGSIRGKWLEVGLEWTDTSACYFVDGKKINCRRSRWLDNAGNPANPAPVLLNLAVGGSWAGRNGIEDERFPMSFDIDHLRVYSTKTATPPPPRMARSGVGYADELSWGTWRGRPVASVETWNDAAQNGAVTWASMLPLYSMHDLVGRLPELNRALRAATGDPQATVSVSVGQPIFASGDSYRSCASGTSPTTAQLTAMATALADLAPDRSAYVRLGWEFNSGYHWKAAPTDGPDFIACWKRWHAALKAASPALKLVWNPNSDMSWSFPLNRFWPGRQYVDAAGPDIYAKADNGVLSSPYQWTGGFKDPVDPTKEVRNPRGVNAWVGYIAAKQVPLAVPEWGVQNDGNTWSSGDPRFINQMRRALEKAAASPTGLAYEDYFDAGPDPGFDCKHSLHHASCTKNAEAARRYRLLWKNPYTT